ncbi:unnamed protein product, partial [marine sediment metagenome]
LCKLCAVDTVRFDNDDRGPPPFKVLINLNAYDPRTRDTSPGLVSAMITLETTGADLVLFVHRPAWKGLLVVEGSAHIGVSMVFSWTNTFGQAWTTTLKPGVPFYGPMHGKTRQ